VKNNFRLLIADNSDQFINDLLKELYKKDYQPEVKQILFFDELYEEISKNIWDLAICDYDFLKSEGNDQMSVFNEKYLNIPTIIISKDPGLSNTTQSLPSHINNIINKNKIEDLLFSIKFELDRINQKQISEQLNTAPGHNRVSFNNIFESSIDSIIITDHNGIITHVNNAFIKLTGYRKSNLINSKLKNFTVHKPGKYNSTELGIIEIEENYLTDIKERLLLLDKEGESTNLQNYYIHSNGSIIPTEQNVWRLFDDNHEKINGYVFIIRNISERTLADKSLKDTYQELEDINTQLEKEIERANQMAVTAEFASVAKTEFLANMSHEIRTPLNGILGFTDLLLHSKMEPEQHDYVDTIKQSGDALLSLINDILDFSKIEAGKTDLESIDFDPEILAYNICDLLSPKITDKPVELLCSIDENVPAELKGDPHRLRQVITNLIGNAIKFTDAGEIKLSINVDEEKDNNIKLHIKVSDTGIGITKKQINVIFDAFKQADGSTTRKFGGTGLGLAICRKISNLMNGDTWAESKKGQGSIFHFTGWFNKSAKKSIERQSPVSLENKKILIIDDEKTSLNIFHKFLKLCKINLHTLNRGSEVLDTLIKAHTDNEPFDICVINMQLNDIDGYSLGRKIRKLDISQMPLLAFSSNTMQDAKKCQDAGFTGYLPKPVNRHKFMIMLESLLSDESRCELEDTKISIKTQHSIAESEKRSLNILLAEDNPVNQKLATIMLKKAGYNITLAENGKEALDKFSATPDAFDIILMDLQMPELDGLSATRSLRKKGFVDIPIIAMTANAMEGDRENCINAGMNDYISKPIKRELVFDKIKKWVIDKDSKR